MLNAYFIINIKKIGNIDLVTIKFRIFAINFLTFKNKKKYDKLPQN